MKAPKKQRALAKANRRHMPDAERRLWWHLRNRGLNGHKFRRQFPIGIYIVDFVCMERSLIVEADGGQHAEDKCIAYDSRRTAFLNQAGFRVIRFWNNEILTQTEAVLEVILSALEGEE